jgi:arylsulfatase A-like enzyme
MLRRLLQSRSLTVALAAALLALAIASLVELRPRGVRTGHVEDLAKLSARSDLSVVFILIDTLRADRLGCYGYARPTSPTLDALAATGVRFAHVTSASSWTKTSMASLWTGLHPVTHGILRYPHGLPDRATLPAEILRDAGFRTAGLWRNGWVAPNFGFGQGFEIYHRPLPGRGPEREARRTPSEARLPGTDEDVTRSAIEFLRGARNDRFLLYLHYMDVHQYVYDDSANFGPELSDLYDNAIRWVDRNVEALVAAIAEQGLADRTVLVITSDHGEGFREHGLEGHARTLYREVIDVPWILVPPFRLDPGIVVSTPAAGVDVWPTLLDLLGQAPLPGAQGASRAGAILAAARAGPEPAPAAADSGAYAELDRTWGTQGAAPDPIVAVIEGPYRWIQPLAGPAAGQLFDHRDDPREQHDVAAREPETAARLRARVAAYSSFPPATWGAPAEVELDQMRLEQLRALGYVVGGDDRR